MLRVEGKPELVSCSDLRGRKIYTVGPRFDGLSSRAFRRILREAGADVVSYPTRATEIIVLGKPLPLRSVNSVMLRVGDHPGTSIVPYSVFVEKFLPAIRSVCTGGSVS